MEIRDVKLVQWLKQASITEGKTLKIMLDENTVEEYTVPSGKTLTITMQINGELA